MVRRLVGQNAKAAPELVRALLDGLAEAATAVEPGRFSDEVAIHEFRKAMKRHRALLRLTAPLRGESATAERRRAGDIARQLAGARDLTAALDGLTDLTRKRMLRAELATPVRAAIEAEREHAHTAQLDATTRAEIVAFEEQARAEAVHLGEADFPMRALIDGLARGYRAMIKAAPADWSVVPSESLHALRKAVVIHRYQMELARPLWPRHIELWIDEAQKLRDRLGAHQDLEALARFVADRPALLDRRQHARLLTALRLRQRQHIVAAEQQFARLGAERPSAFADRLYGYAVEHRLTMPPEAAEAAASAPPTQPASPPKTRSARHQA